MNIYDFKIPESGEIFTMLLKDKNIKIVQIVSSDNLEITEYCQEENEFVVLLEGEAVLEIDGERRVLNRGDTLFIPAKTKHKILSVKKGTLWLTIHYENSTD